MLQFLLLAPLNNLLESSDAKGWQPLDYIIPSCADMATYDARPTPWYRGQIPQPVHIGLLSMHMYRMRPERVNLLALGLQAVWYRWNRQLGYGRA